MIDQKEIDFKIIYDRLQSRLEELELGAKLPPFGIFRITMEIALDYYGQQGEEEAHPGITIEAPGVDLTDCQFAFRPGMMGPYQGRVLLALTKSGEMVSIGFVVNGEEEGLITHGHQITIEGGKVISRHEDGSTCIIACRTCEHPDIWCEVIDGEHYCYCSHCGAKTETYPNSKYAIAAWLLGRLNVHASL